MKAQSESIQRTTKVIEHIENREKKILKDQKILHEKVAKWSQ